MLLLLFLLFVLFTHHGLLTRGHDVFLSGKSVPKLGMRVDCLHVRGRSVRVVEEPF